MKMKRIKGLMCLVFVALFFGLFNCSFFVSAANNREIESNDTRDTATVINVNNTVTGNFYKKYDVDYYKFTVSNQGYASIKFEHNYINSLGGYWTVTFYDSQMKEFKSFGVVGENMITSTGNIGLPSGTYYVMISNSYNYSDIDYQLTVFFNSSNIWETERNNTYDTYDSISLNKAIYGSFFEKYDEDYYRFITSSNGYISIVFDHKYIDSLGGYWTITLYDSQMKSLDSFGIVGKDMTTTSSKVFLPAGTYYVRISNSYNYSDVDYQLTVIFSNSNNNAITFNANGGKVSPESVSIVSSGSTILPTPTRTGYSCLGWATSSSATSAEYACGSSFSPSSDTVLYAVWSPDSSGEDNNEHRSNGVDLNNVLTIMISVWNVIRQWIPYIINLIKMIISVV